MKARGVNKRAQGNFLIKEHRTGMHLSHEAHQDRYYTP